MEEIESGDYKVVIRTKASDEDTDSGRSEVELTRLSLIEGKKAVETVMKDMEMGEKKVITVEAAKIKDRAYQCEIILASDFDSVSIYED